MKNNILNLIFLSLFLLLSCSPEENEDKQLLPFSTDPCELVTPTPDSLRYIAIYGKPILMEPDNSVYYSSERVDIKWSLPGDLWNTELQLIELNKPYDCFDYEKFHLLDNNAYGYGNQYVHHYITTENFSPIQDTIFVSYRARSTDVQMVKEYSEWTDVKSITIVPLSNLEKEIVTTSFKLNFTTGEINHFYYSGVAKATNYRLSELANDYNINYDKIRLVRVVNFDVIFNTLMSDGKIPFERLMIGFNENINPQETVYPFEVIGDVYPGSFEESPVPGTLYDNLPQNIISDMKNYDLKVAYALEDVAGSQHEIILNLTFEIYSEN